MKISSPRHLNRRLRLAELIVEAEGGTKLADAVGTPKSHVSAMLHGKRGLGDKLAAKMERKMKKEPGWMDQPATADKVAAALAYEPPTPVEAVVTGEPRPGYEAEISVSEWDQLLELRDMSGEDRAFLKGESSARSQRYKQMRQEIMARLGIKGDADPASVEKALGNVPKDLTGDRVIVRIIKVERADDDPPEN